MTAATATRGGSRTPGFFDALAPGGARALFFLSVAAILFLFTFPVFWLVLTSLKPGWEVFYVHRSIEFTWGNYVDVLQEEIVLDAFINSFVIATAATILSLAVTVSSGYMLSRFRGPIANTWFGTIYLFRCIPYISNGSGSSTAISASCCRMSRCTFASSPGS
jgi:multiple sugar transport system permease protein